MVSKNYLFWIFLLVLSSVFFAQFSDAADSVLRVSSDGRNHFFTIGEETDILIIDTYSKFGVETYNDSAVKVLFLGENYILEEDIPLKIDIEEDEIYDYTLMLSGIADKDAIIFIQKISEEYIIPRNPPRSDVPIPKVEVPEEIIEPEPEKTLTEQTVAVVKENLKVPFIKWLTIIGGIVVILLLGAFIYERRKRISKSKKVDPVKKVEALHESSGKNIYEEAQDKLSEGMEVPEKVESIPKLEKIPVEKVAPPIEPPEKPKALEEHNIPELHVNRPISNVRVEKKPLSELSKKAIVEKKVAKKSTPKKKSVKKASKKKVAKTKPKKSTKKK